MLVGTMEIDVASRQVPKVERNLRNLGFLSAAASADVCLVTTTEAGVQPLTLVCLFRGTPKMLVYVGVPLN